MPRPLEELESIRTRSGDPLTVGLPDAVIERFAERDPALRQAIANATAAFAEIQPEQRALAEKDFALQLQADFLNFYPASHLNPFVALAAHGPWLITAYGAVLHDSGGYGMLGFGHSPADLLATMAKPWVQANVMTPSLSHQRFGQALRREIGNARGACPFEQFLCINSGSESVTVAARISDINAHRQTADGGRHQGRDIAFLGLRGGFHGRTGRPAQVSDSSSETYRANLASFRDVEKLRVVEINDCPGLEAAFAAATADGVFLEAMFVEPVMGEGNPGVAVTREFYDLARRLTKANDTLLLVDSIQAGLRAQGCLSIVDYPGFEDCEAPDLETYSKALNAGQYPLSVLAMNKYAADLYVRGVYGNTMTTNPRALEVACAVLARVTPDLRRNIRERGAELLVRLSELSEEFPGAIRSVQGTGLLLAAELDPGRLPVTGFGNVEEYCRRHGIGVIHGGTNALRYTPHFAITSAEIELIVDNLRGALRHFLAR